MKFQFHLNQIVKHFFMFSNSCCFFRHLFSLFNLSRGTKSFSVCCTFVFQIKIQETDCFAYYLYFAFI